MMTITVPGVAALIVAAVACAWDLKTRRIPNVLTMPAAVLALLFHTISTGWHGTLLSAVGVMVGLAIFFPLFALRGMGAGDVKLLGVLGAWLGPWLVIWTAVYGAIAGGILAILVAASHRYLWRALRNLYGLFFFWTVAGVKPMPALTLADAAGPRLAYALPIALGTVVTLWLRA